MSDEIRPFLPVVTSPTRPLVAALHNVVTLPVTSPWTPRTVEEPGAVHAQLPASPTEAELAIVYEEARADGRADGLTETAALRHQLAALLAELVTARAAVVAPTAELITDVASCVIETWIEHTPRGELFAPLVRSWVARSPDQPATVRVHPDDLAAITAVVGDAPLAIAADPALAPGALAITSPTLELCHDWRARLPDLRTAIASALEGAEP